jgi:hypothetical protein
MPDIQKQLEDERAGIDAFIRELGLQPSTFRAHDGTLLYVKLVQTVDAIIKQVAKRVV